ncbi:glycosyltransferase family A protein [Flavivirga abyssicola]|uniref:glycosyltransferase family A protein n=1 Tax=Flavivirga abyssicola TaxID=3063533 RepID=UPI0026E06C1F|nr:glycosyltransferase family A protein [Flavivirga sp. MEBiC07777]WVK13643.1 glycosyltransferase family A protein [Flavivirga sp. MEBiC07777]
MEVKSNVTVIIPCFNDGAYIIEALNSVLNQTLKPEKVIIVDDGSDAKTKQIIESIDFKAVEIIFQKNKGVSSARNKAVSLAKTEFILNLDADDYFDLTFIEKAVDVLNNNSKIAAVGCYAKTLKNNKLKSEIRKPLGGSIKNFLIRNNLSANSMFRKECWEKAGGYDEQMTSGYEDWEFWISILKNNWESHVIKEPLFIYRIKNNSRDANALKRYDFKLRRYIFDKHKELFLNHYEFCITQLLRDNSVLRADKIKTKDSLDYKIGNLLLKPLRVLKGIISNKE